MQRSLLAAIVLATAVLSPAQTISTVGTPNYSGGPQVAAYFDLEVVQKVSLTGFDVYCNEPSTAGTVAVFILPGGRAGAQTNPVPWLPLVPVTSVTSDAFGMVSAPLTAFPLCPGNYGIAYVLTGLSLALTTGNGGNEYFENAYLRVHCGEAGAAAFAGTLLDPVVVNTTVNATAGGGTCHIATAFPFGKGCVGSYASFYEHFPLASMFDLSNTSITLVPGAGGYTVIPGVGSYWPGPYTTLPVGDNGESAWSFTPPLPLPCGATASNVVVCANGVVAVRNGFGSSGCGTDPIPSPAKWLNLSDRVYGTWHDFDPTVSGSGPVTISIVPGLHVLYVFTWNGVADHGLPGTSSTFQIQFDTLNGMVHMLWQTMSNTGSGYVVGYSPAGASLDPGATDLSNELPQLGCSDQPPLTLRMDPRPILPSTPNFVTSHIPVGSTFGVVALDFNCVDPGLNLALFGWPGCSLYIGAPWLVGLSYFVIGDPVNTPITIPNNPIWIGTEFCAQSIALTAASSLVFSNGLHVHIGDL